VRRIVLAVLLALPGLAVGVSPAQAQTPSGNLGNGSVGSGIEVPGGNGSSGPTNTGTGASSSGGGSSSSGGSAPTTKWTRHYWGDKDDPGYGGVNTPILCGAGERAYQDVESRISDGVLLGTVNGCEAARIAGTPVTTTPPPPPPTSAEVRNLTPLPVPTFGVSPRGTGLTGLPTWLWDSNGATPRTATSTIRGYTVISTARPIRWTWNMAATGPSSRSNPPSVVNATRPGSETDPAARYTYETHGEYGLTLDVTWGGSYTYSGNGVAAVTTDLGTTTRSSSRSFAVTEVRPVLVSG
jgi:hypothetical protein